MLKTNFRSFFSFRIKTILEISRNKINLKIQKKIEINNLKNNKTIKQVYTII